MSEVATTRRFRWSTVIKAGFLITALAFGAAYLASYWAEARAALVEVNRGALVGAVALAAAGQVTAMLGWRAALSDLGHRLPAVSAARVFYLSQLGKYIPGSVWQFAALMELGRRYVIPRRDLAVSGVLVLLASLTSAGVTGVVVLLLGGVSEARSWSWTIPIFVMGAVLLLHPRIAGPIVNRLFGLLGRVPLERTWTVGGLLVVLAWHGVTWIFYGLQCWLLVIGLGADPASTFAPAVGGFAIAYAAGMLFLPAPAGAGVREAVLAALLVGSLSPGGVLVAVLLSRVVLAALDCLLGLLMLPLGGRPGHPNR